MICGFSVGAKGFEPSTSCTPCKRASRAAPRPEQSKIISPLPIFCNEANGEIKMKKPKLRKVGDNVIPAFPNQFTSFVRQIIVIIRLIIRLIL